MLLCFGSITYYEIRLEQARYEQLFGVNFRKPARYSASAAPAPLAGRLCAEMSQTVQCELSRHGNSPTIVRNFRQAEHNTNDEYRDRE